MLPLPTLLRPTGHRTFFQYLIFETYSLSDSHPFYTPNPVSMVSGRDPISTMGVTRNSPLEDENVSPPLPQSCFSDVATSNSIEATCSCGELLTLRQWNARGFNVRKGEHAHQRAEVAGKVVATFCRCQVVARGELRRAEPATGWVDNPALYQERSGTYLRPWYEASDTVDRS